MTIEIIIPRVDITLLGTILLYACMLFLVCGGCFIIYLGYTRKDWGEVIFGVGMLVISAFLIGLSFHMITVKYE
jgi:hypothetical protein